MQALGPTRADPFDCSSLRRTSWPGHSLRNTLTRDWLPTLSVWPQKGRARNSLRPRRGVQCRHVPRQMALDYIEVGL